MDDSLASRVPLPPAELVNNRIDENRLFEARFLFGKFSREIDPLLREKIQQQLTQRIELAQQAFSRGELQEQAGELKKAAGSFAEVAAFAIDYPGLDQARQRVEISIKLVSQLPEGPAPSELPKPAARKSSPVVVPAAPSIVPTAALPLVKNKKLQLIAVFFLLITLGGIGVAFVFRAGNGSEDSKKSLFVKEPKPRITLPAIQPVAKKRIPAREVNPVLSAPVLNLELSNEETLPRPPQGRENIIVEKPLPEEPEQTSRSGSLHVPTPSFTGRKFRVDSAGRKINVYPLRIEGGSTAVPGGQAADLIVSPGKHRKTAPPSVEEVGTRDRDFRNIYGNSWRLQEMNTLLSGQAEESEAGRSESASRVQETFIPGNGDDTD